MNGLPKGWVAATVGDTGEYVNGMAFKPTDWDDVGLPIIRIQNLTDPTRTPNRTSRKVERRYIVERGDILVSWSATLDAFLWDREQAVLNQHIFKVIPDQDVVDRSFLFHSLRHVIAEMMEGEHLHGSTMKHINRGPFLAHPFPLPPLPEQRRIVAKIDSLTAKSRRARDHLDHIPRLVEKYKQAILAAAFRGDLTREWRMQRGAATFWEATSPADHFVWSSGKNLPTKKQVEGSVPVIGGNGIGGYHNEPLIDFPTLVIGRVGAQCGNVHLTSGPAWITDNAIYARSISKSVDLEYAAIFFRNANLNQLAGGSGQPYINQSTLNSLSLNLPNFSEQREIVRRTHLMINWIDRLAAEAASARKLIDRLDQALLAKAFRGELVPQDPADEPASVLLERIRTERGTAPKARRGRRPAAEA
ncbi:restriction endonuclease subunit S [Xanthobacter oligotrophicus]|uniref:restriction endonuclease subunit S n=1 Tax=Xanthobacter oligotrophicus TaxID=2607286 RepID=UPI0011F2BFB1|nr:restriction endonuclease subunit S [Xanthobacter oligotrophicus]MCG5236129.1 restriction endonuclease subunit S [Xanthobacter oligotrophicus]